MASIFPLIEFYQKHFITRPNCALDRSTVLCLYVPGFQRQVVEHVKILSGRSKESKEQKKNKGSVLVTESAYNAQNAQFGLVIFPIKYLKKFCVLLYFDLFCRKKIKKFLRQDNTSGKQHQNQRFNYILRHAKTKCSKTQKKNI